MLRLVLLALLPQIGGILLMVSRSAMRPTSKAELTDSSSGEMRGTGPRETHEPTSRIGSDGEVDPAQSKLERYTASLAGFQRTRLAGVNDQFFLSDELERAVTFHVDGVSKIAIIGWEHGNNDAAFMVVGCFIDPIANRKLRHRELLLESSMRLSHRFALTRLNQWTVVSRFPLRSKRHTNHFSYGPKAKPV